MFNNLAKSTDTVSSGLVCGTKPEAKARAGGVYKVQCVGADGHVKWEEKMHNLVVNQGLQNMVATYLDAATQTTTWYLGLITGPGSGTTIAAGDTLASHAGWTEFTNYTGTRKTAVFGTATTADPSVIDNTASPASFGITGAGGNVAGAFLASVTSGTSGILFSASDFQSPGDRVVVTGDTLNVSYTFSLDAV
tara:strand:+ start:774 stop:1352 length:579 start_codon:yes stop_codon:yes gene_type:complete